jgi:methionyl-tRNA formyltransferase
MGAIPVGLRVGDKGGGYMRIVVLMNKCSHGAEILRELHNHNLKIEAIIMEQKHQTIKRRAKKIYKNILGAWWEKDSFYNKFAPVSYFKDFNGTDCEELLEIIEPDCIILGGTKILKKNILKTPKYFTLNGHPGWLPEYRGMDVIPWAILTEGRLGITIHIVDQGIDSGTILDRKRLMISRDDTLESLAGKAEKLIAKEMAITLHKLDNDNAVFTPNESGKYWHLMTPEQKESARTKLKEMQKVMK